MKKFGGILLISFVAFNAFGAAKKMYKKKKKQEKKTTSVSQNKNQIKSLLMGRTACFGQCPSYTIEIFETGMMRYVGKSYSPLIGSYEKNIGSENAAKLLKEFNTINPKSFDNTYERRIADLPGFYYYISYSDSVKKIMNADAGPELLREWAVKIDEFSNINSDWKKVSEVPIKKQ